MKIIADSKWSEQIKITLTAKLKSVNQEEKLLKRNERFKNQLRNPHEITDKKIINGQLDIKLGHFMEEELDVALKTNKQKKINK